ncbi:hypothetical protein EJ08DRAFT_653165 [Tothia fuscella]|uniref:Uncharacterized protein n=1 Tax=Tothia fuscella TaxID=1048955 RepID=A0A9P4NII0_9PEZI|nr:hypothetical protein EJ08DRAFT_653165 [Tothia fuscella]
MTRFSMQLYDCSQWRSVLSSGLLHVHASLGCQFVTILERGYTFQEFILEFES